MDFTWLGSGQPWVGLGGHRPTHWGARPSQSEFVFPHKNPLLQTEILLSVISCPGGWSQTIPQVKKPDMEVLGRHGYTWSLEAVYGREMNIQLSGNSSGGHSFRQHANCRLCQLETSVAMCCVTKFDILKWCIIFPSTRCTCLMIMLFNQLLDMTHLSGGLIILV